MAQDLPLPEGKVEADHDLCPSPLEEWRIVASALLFLDECRETDRGRGKEREREREREIVVVEVVVVVVVVVRRKRAEVMVTFHPSSWKREAMGHSHTFPIPYQGSPKTLPLPRKRREQRP